jgi:hypothetical protein
MSNPERENLIGYLLGALEPQEKAQVDRQLEQDESLRQELTALQKRLAPLLGNKDHLVPPAELAQRCCDYVYSRAEVMPTALSPIASSTAVRSRWSWLELSVAGAIAAAVAVFLLPNIYQSQIQSQILACQNNLKDIGYSAADYSERNGGYYPAVQPGDRINAAGMWAPTLVSQNYVPQGGKTFVCPGSQQADLPGFHVPTIDELQAMKAKELAAVLPQLSGSYAITLGYHDNADGRYRLQKDQHREHFAVAADRPGKNGTNSPNHGGRGQDVLFDDGHVQWLTTPEIGADGDNIFVNGNHLIEAGIHSNDAVIAPSDTPAK